MRSRRERIGRMLWLVGSACVALATLTPSPQAETNTALCLICGDLATVDLLLNIVLFVPVGIGLALDGVRARRAVFAMVAATIAIEALQLVSIPGRDASAADVVSNALGGLIGFAIGTNSARILHPNAATARRLLAAWIGVWLTVQAVGAFTQRGAPTTPDYFGQIAPDLGGQPPYPGAVIDPRIDGMPVSSARMGADVASRLRAAQASAAGFVVEATVVPRALTAQATALVRVADDDEHEILVLAAEGSDLVFSARSRGTALRLRTPWYRLRNVFREPRSFGADTVRVAATYSPREVTLRAASGEDVRHASIDQSAGGFWRLLYPARSYDAGSTADAMLDAGFVLLLLLPAGYWGYYAARLAGGRARAGLVALLSLSIAVGSVAIPAAFAVPSTWRDIAAAVASCVVGAAAARLSMSRSTADYLPIPPAESVAA